MMLFFYRKDTAVDVGHCKNMFFLFTAFFGVIVFGIKSAKPIDYLLTLPFVLLGFFNMWHLGSYTGLIQWLSITAGAILFLQSKGFDQKLIKKYLSLICVAASASILLGYFKIDFYDIIGTPNYPSKGKGLIKGKTYEMQYFHGLLGGIGHTAILAALTASISGPIVFVIGLLATFKVAAMGTMTPLLGLCAGLLARVLNTRAKVLIFIPILIGTMSGMYLTQPLIPKAIDSEISQLNTSARQNIWKGAIYSALKKPIIGRGPGYFADMMKMYYTKKMKRGEKAPLWRQVHNDFIETFLAFGLVGLILLGYVLFKAFKNLNHNREIVSGVATLCVIALTWFPIHIAIVSPIAIILLSLSQLKHEERSLL